MAESSGAVGFLELDPSFDAVPSDVPVVHDPGPAVSADPFLQVLPAGAPVEAAPDPAFGGFTGARVYGDPQRCDPCRYLEADLQFLRDNYGWRLSRSADVPADWQILPAGGREGPIPLIEFWRDGVLVGSQVGYSCDSAFECRASVLRELCAAHPGKQDALVAAGGR